MGSYYRSPFSSHMLSFLPPHLLPDSLQESSINSKVSFDPNLLFLLTSDFYRALHPWNLRSSRCQWLSLMNPQTLKKQVQHFPLMLKDVCWFCKICIYPASTQRTHVVLFACSKDKFIHFALLSRVKSAGKNPKKIKNC